MRKKFFGFALSSAGAVLFALCAMLLAPCAFAEERQAKKVYRIGYLAASLSTATEPREEAFMKGLRELGYVH